MRNYYSLINGMGSGTIPSTLNNGLYAVYKAESNANDSFSTYNGTALGGLTYTTGKNGNAFNLNGTTSYIDMGDVMDIGTSSWTYSFWFNANDVVTNQMLFSKSLAGSSTGRLWCALENNRIKWNFQADGSNIINTEMSLSTIGLNTWYNVVLVLDRADKLKIYINGSLQTLTVTGGTNNLIPYSATNYNTNHPFRIGSYTASDNTTPVVFFNGKIDEFNIYNRVLTATEITELQTKYYPF
jgi:hypothetical protein